MLGAKVAPGGPNRDYGCQDALDRTRRRCWVPRWLQEDQAEITGVSMGLSRSGADDGSCAGSSRAKQMWWVLRQVPWCPVVLMGAEMGLVCYQGWAPCHTQAVTWLISSSSTPEWATSHGEPPRARQLPKGPPVPTHPPSGATSSTTGCTPVVPVVFLPVGWGSPGTRTVITLVPNVPRSPGARRLLSSAPVASPSSGGALCPTATPRSAIA